MDGWLTTRLISASHQVSFLWNFPGGPMVKNLPCHSEDAGSILEGETKIPQAEDQLSPLTTMKDPA